MYEAWEQTPDPEGTSVPGQAGQSKKCAVLGSQSPGSRAIILTQKIRGHSDWKKFCGGFHRQGTMLHGIHRVQGLGPEYLSGKLIQQGGQLLCLESNLWDPPQVGNAMH